jgi:hypothetical protein
MAPLPTAEEAARHILDVAVNMHDKHPGESLGLPFYGCNSKTSILSRRIYRGAWSTPSTENGFIFPRPDRLM